jgi:hypothetical protein
MKCPNFVYLFKGTIELYWWATPAVASIRGA